uniref:Uncharacterized protein n=1 Tax=viral metagenome TaxID=1070528 RepID=A0A6M3L7R4_9ZZZZ
MRTREERRDEERRYEGDVVYDVWRNGGNPDRVNLDRVQEHFDRGDQSDCAVRDELRHQRPPQPEYEYPEETEVNDSIEALRGEEVK